MTTKNEYHQFSENELTVLAFLKNLKQYAPENFDYLVFYGASAREMIKFMEYPEKYGNFDFVYVCGLFESIRKTFNHYIIPQPEITVQVEEDRILASTLICSDHAFSSIYSKERMINKSHLIDYLLRKDVIFNWNGLLVSIVQKIVEKLKAELHLKLGSVC